MLNDRGAVSGGMVADEPAVKGPLWSPGEGAVALWHAIGTWNRDHRTAFRSYVGLLASVLLLSSSTVVHRTPAWPGWTLLALLTIARFLWVWRRVQHPYTVPANSLERPRGSWW